MYSFVDSFFLAGRGADGDESIQIHGRANGVHHQGRRRRNTCCWDLSEDRVSQATYFTWKKKYAGMLSMDMKKLRELEDENGRLKKIVADLSLDKEMLQDVIERMYGPPRLCKVLPDDVRDCINASGLSRVGWFSS